MVSLDEAGIVPQTAAARLHLPVLVRDLMTTNPVTVEPTATVKDIAQLLLHHDIRAVPVVDIGDQLVGVVSEADLVCREGTRRRAAITWPVSSRRQWPSVATIGVLGRRV